MKNICVLPFMHTLILPNGDINLCCNSIITDTLPSVTDSVSNILNNAHHVEVRKQMLAGMQPSSCGKCWNAERLGIKSYRQQQNFTYMSYFPRTLFANKNGQLNSGVKFFDVRFNNTCNLKCVMCSSDYSSSWVDDEKKLIPILQDSQLKDHFIHRSEQYDKEVFKWSKDADIVNAIIANASSLERLHFAGGEPLLSKQHIVLIKELIKLKLAPRLFLSYNTNGEFIDNELLSLWSHFKRVKIFYSLDGIGDHNDYIRFPSKWKDHETRLDFLDSATPKNVDWRLLTTVSALNIAYMPELADWKLTKNYKNIHNNFLDGNLFHASLLETPNYLNSTVLPLTVKEDIKQKLLGFTNSRSYNRIANDCINFMCDKDDSNLLPNMKEYLNGIDSIRGTDFKKTFPILQNLS